MKNLAFVTALLATTALFADGPSVDLAQSVGPFKKGLHGSNTTLWLYPVRSGNEAADAALLKSLKFTETRTDDWSNVDRGQSIVDVYNVFPLLHLDASNPTNYVFEQTDDLIALDRSASVGAPTVCYRLGASDDKSLGHFNSAMPTNFAQYAEACAGIVRHYTSGWGNGPTNAVARWEIWDSPDDADAGWYAEGLSETERRAAFAAFYATVLKRLRDEFGTAIEIGGPGLTTYRECWFEAILNACAAKGVKPDTLSFRAFGTNVADVTSAVTAARAYLDAHDAADVGLTLSAWHYQSPLGTTTHGDAAALFTAKMLATLPYTPFARAYFYGTGATGNWSLFPTTERNVPVLQLYGKLVADADETLAATSTAATTVLGTRSADGLTTQLFVVDETSGTGAVQVNLTGAARVKAVSAELVDSANDGASVAATYADGVLTLPKKAGGATAWRVMVTLPPPAPTLTVGEPQDGTVTLTLSNVVTDLALAVAYGRTDAGDVPRHWEKFETLGVLTNGTTSYVYQLPPSWGDQVGALRFFVTELADLPVAFLDGATMDQSGKGAAKPQWFDTGVKVTETVRCDVDWTPTALATNTSEWVFSSASSPAFEVYKNPSCYPGYAYGATGTKTMSAWAPATVGARATWVLDGRAKVMSRGVDTLIKISTSWSGTGGDLVIGRGLTGAGVCGTIHGVKVWKGWTPLRDFVPAQTLAADGSRVTGFYDKVGGIFRASGGSAAFVAGSEVAWEPADLGNLVVLASSTSVTTAVEAPFPHVAKWRGNRAAAISYTFDDGYAEQYTTIEPKLREHGFRATFFLVTKMIGSTITGTAKGMTWAQATTLADRGHDLGNHGYNSYYHKSYPRATIKKDTWDNQTNILARTGYEPVSFAHPNRDVVGFSDAVITECGLKYYVIDRVSLGTASSTQLATAEQMDAVVAEAVRMKSWQVFITHAITNGYAAWTSTAPLFDHLDHTAANADVWVDSMAHVGAYEKLRKATAVTVEQVGDDDYKVCVTPPAFAKPACGGTLDIVNTRGETRAFDPYAGDFHLKNGEIVYGSADRFAVVQLRDWMGKDLGSVTGVVLGTTFSLNATNYFNGTVDYVTAFDGGTVAAAPSTSVASGSKVTWKDIGDGLETEIFIQPRVPCPATPRYGIADPWVVKSPTANLWYMAIAGSSLKFRTSTTFPAMEWGDVKKGETSVYTFADHTDEMGEYLYNAWAPEMHYIRGNWYIYTCLSCTSGDDTTQRIHCFKLDGTNPLSTTGWHLAKRMVTPGTKDTDTIAWAIDATVLDDTDATGRMWLIWSGWPSQNTQYLYMSELASPTSFVANAKRVLLSKPTESWEQLNRRVNEGPVVLRHGDATHVVYSCNGCASDDYSLAILTCTNGDYGVASSWTKHDGRIFTTRATAYGPGHCSFTKDAAGNDYVVYHAKTEAGHTDSYWSYRTTRQQPIAWHGDFPVLGAPRPYEGEVDAFDPNADFTKADADRRILVHCPSSLIETKPYTGQEQSPSWTKYASVTVVSGGARTEPGTNTVTLALADPTRYVWTDGTTADKTAKFAIVAAHGHVWGDWTTNVVATCLTNGLATRVCIAEGCSEPVAVQTNELAALGHAWSAWVTDVEPQPGVSGHKYRDCTRCTAHEEGTIAPLPIPSVITTNAMANVTWGYEIHGLGAATNEVALVFTNTTVTMDWTLPENVTALSYLVVGGGGGGGGYLGGGGGAGRMIGGDAVACTAGATLSVQVGKGGSGSAAQTIATGATGSDSTLGFDTVSVVAAGGGHGGYGDSSLSTKIVGLAGGAGGSGGGAGGVGGSSNSSGSLALSGGAVVGTDGSGSSGGSIVAGKIAFCGAGGGGAGAVGSDATAMSARGGVGGAGRQSAITGETLYYAAGGSGGGGSGNPVPGQPLGGGGAGGYGVKSAGTYLGENGQSGRGSGGGGGGSGGSQPEMQGGDGGSGIVVVRYCPSEQPTPVHVHVWGDWTTNVVATCLTNGLLTRACEAVGCTVPVAVETNELAALGHAWGEWVIDVPPQIGVAGHKYRDCARCTAHEEETIAPLQPVPSEITTNAMANASWGYEIHGLGVASNEVALVFTNTTATMTWTLPADVETFTYLLVGGGGGGAGGSGGVAYGRGGGGAGGVVTATVSVTSRDLTVNVGQGGAGRLATVSTIGVADRGSNTVLKVGEEVSVVAYGGGGGGLNKAGTGGATIGCGGGGSNSLDGGAVTSGQGCNGGKGGGNYCGGGGGGAGQPGTTPSSTAPGHGGDGIESAITGTSQWYAGGGGGSKNNNASPTVRAQGGKGGGGKGGYGAANTGYSDGGDATYFGGGGGGALRSGTGGDGYPGVVIVRYRTGAAPAGKWDEVESSQVEGVTAENKAAVETTLSAIQAALPTGATSADVSAWLTTVYGNQKVPAETLANAKHVGISVKYDLPILVSETPTVTVAASSEPVSADGVAAFVFTIMDGENAVTVTNAKLQDMVLYAQSLATDFGPSTDEQVQVRPDGTAFKAELQRLDGQTAGFMKVELK